MKRFIFIACGLLLTLIHTGCGEDPLSADRELLFKIAFDHTTQTDTGRMIALYTVNTDGSDLQEVGRLGVVRWVNWSPDGTKLAFDNYATSLTVVDVADLEFRSFEQVNPSQALSWFEDSKHVAYSINDTIYSLDVTSDTRRAIGPGRGPVVSPDGEKIAFTKEHALYVMNSDGSQAEHKVDSVSGRLAWSPDGERIAFYKNSSLWTITRDGDKMLRLTGEEITAFGPLSWSPDSKLLTHIGTTDNRAGVMVTHSDGQGSTRIAPDALSPQWHPAPGKNVIFYYSPAKKMLMKINADGSQAREIVPMDSFGVLLSVSPVPVP